MSNQAKMPVESSDLHASILAAFARIESVPTGKTLIDAISDEDWLETDYQGWNLNVGSNSINDADEADSSDTPKSAVA